MITDILVGSFNENTLKQFLDTHGSVGFHTLHTKLTDLKVQLSQVYHDNYKKMFKVSSGALTLSMLMLPEPVIRAQGRSG